MGMDLLELLSGLAPPDTPAAAAQAPQGPQGDAPSQDVGSVIAPHQFRGMFGLHGGLRDILGTIGDAFLVQQGAHPVYALRQQQEREANAMQHLQDDPMQAVQALSRVNPDAAREMYHNLIRDQAYAEDQRSTSATRAQTTEDRARAAFSALGGAANERTWPAIRQRLLAMRDAGHLDVPDALLPEQYSEDVPGALIRMGTAPGTQLTADNLDTYRTSRLSQIDAAQQERGRYHRDLVGLGHDRVGVAREGVGVARDRVGVARQAVGVQQGNLDERVHHDRWDETHPSRSRRAVPGAAPTGPLSQAQIGAVFQRSGATPQEGHRYRIGNQIVTYSHGTFN